MANPTNKVLVMVGAASGCCAMAVNAWETERPSPSAGKAVPIAVVNPAVMMEVTPISVRLSILNLFS